METIILLIRVSELLYIYTYTDSMYISVNWVKPVESFMENGSEQRNIYYI